MPLKRKQVLALEELASGESIADTARSLGVGRSTIHAWLRTEEFKKSLAEAKEELLRTAFNRLRRMANDAADALHGVATAPRYFNQHPGASASAAKAILELSIRAREHDEFEARLRKLEGAGDEEKEQWEYEPVPSIEDSSEE